MSIAYYDSIIAECDKKIAELTDSKNQVISVLPSVVSCSNNTAKVNTHFSNLVFLMSLLEVLKLRMFLM